MSFDWAELPDISDVRDALYTQANIKAQLKIAKLELEIYQADMAPQKPRDSSVKLIGIDDTSRAHIQELLNRVVSVESELDTVDASVKFHSYRLEAAKALMYRSRI